VFGRVSRRPLASKFGDFRECLAADPTLPLVQDLGSGLELSFSSSISMSSTPLSQNTGKTTSKNTSYQSSSSLINTWAC
jgi:hypothetical protein